jgi:predicted MFS family arabinose efflux permease
MTRWLLFALALVAVGVAAWVWLASPPGSSEEIGPASRAELERVLRENP